MYVQVKDKRLELEKLKSTFVRRASDFLRKYFSSVVDFMISDKTYFSQVKTAQHKCLRYLSTSVAGGMFKNSDAFDVPVYVSFDKNCW